MFTTQNVQATSQQLHMWTFRVCFAFTDGLLIFDPFLSALIIYQRLVIPIALISAFHI